MRPYLLLLAVILCASCASNGGVARRPALAAPPRHESSAAAQYERDFQTGKRVYDLHCARCHGWDGKDNTYPFIATLDGIGKRMTPEEILEATWATGFASPRQFTDDEKRGLGIYVASL